MATTKPGTSHLEEWRKKNSSVSASPVSVAPAPPTPKRSPGPSPPPPKVVAPLVAQKRAMKRKQAESRLKMATPATRAKAERDLERAAENDAKATRKLDEKRSPTKQGALDPRCPRSTTPRPSPGSR